MGEGIGYNVTGVTGRDKHLELWEEEEPRPPPESLKIVCEPFADYVPWRDDVPEIEVG